jgi:hypothetical protein
VVGRDGEAANTLRRAVLPEQLSQGSAALAHADLLELRVELLPYSPVVGRVWELRRTITAYDAWYVALAESLDAPLATLDHRLARAPGPRCSFELLPDTPHTPITHSNNTIPKYDSLNTDALSVPRAMSADHRFADRGARHDVLWIAALG